MIRILLLAALILAGCATPAKVQTAIEFGTRAPGLTIVTMHIKNQENRATTPLLVTITVQFKQGATWGKPAPVIHPAAFVLKGMEEQILRSTIKGTGEAIKASIEVKEQESGTVLKTEEVERAL